MIIFLYGSDDYRREQKKRWYKKEFEKKYSGLSVRAFDFSDEKGDALEDLRGFVRAQPLFSTTGGQAGASGGESKKLAVLENLYEVKEEDLGDVLREVAAKKATIVLCSEKDKPASVLSFLLEAPATAERFEYLTGYEWEMFMRERAKKLGLEFSDFAFKFLAAVYQNNTWGFITELQKISSLKRGLVDKKDLAGLDLEIAPDYWNLINGMKNSDLRIRLAVLEKLFAMGDPPPKIFNILASGWREKIPQMAEYDLRVKSGKLDYEEVLLDLVLG
jgi:DNA polymerase III delta subunit